MKRSSLVLMFCLFPIGANAQSAFYIEGSVGAGFIQEVDGMVENLNIPGYAQFEGTATRDYRTEAAFGAEVGLQIESGFRFGISYDYIDTGLDTVSLRGTLDDPNVVGDEASLDGEIGSSGLSGKIDGIGFSDSGVSMRDVAGSNGMLSATISVLAANVYYSPGDILAAQLYVGGGLGAAFVEGGDTKFAWSGTVGFRYPFGERIYAGARYRLQYISDPNINDGFGDYDSFLNHQISAVLGVYLN